MGLCGLDACIDILFGIAEQELHRRDGCMGTASLRKSAGPVSMTVMFPAALTVVCMCRDNVVVYTCTYVPHGINAVTSDAS